MSEPKQIVINVTRRRRVEHDALVTLTVKPESNVEFHSALEQLVSGIPGLIRVKVDEILDADTKQPVKLVMIIDSENQEIAARYLEKGFGQLINYCISIQ